MTNLFLHDYFSIQEGGINCKAGNERSGMMISSRTSMKGAVVLSSSKGKKKEKGRKRKREANEIGEDEFVCLEKKIL